MPDARFIASTATSTSRRARTPGSKRSRCRTPRTRTTTGTSGSPPSATRPNAVGAHPRRRATASSRIVNNYASISFNFGPTLLSLAASSTRRRPTHAIVEADRASRERFARPRLRDRAGLQPHDHAAREPRATSGTQVRWGIARFRASLRPQARRDVAAGDGRRRRHARGAGRRKASRSRSSRRTRRSRWRADRRRATGATSTAAIDPTTRLSLQRCRRAQRSRSSSTTARSRAPSPSSGCSTRGENLAHRLLERASPTPHARPQLVHIATDGETYGHHHRYGDMALAYALALHRDATSSRALTNYGEFLANASADAGSRDRREHVVELRARRRALASDCGCNTGGRPAGTSSGARRCARRSTGCATNVRRIFEARGATLLRDPWAARDDYIDVVLDRSRRQRRRASSRSTRTHRRRPRRRVARSCWRCSATRC